MNETDAQMRKREKRESRQAALVVGIPVGLISLMWLAMYWSAI